MEIKNKADSAVAWLWHGSRQLSASLRWGDGELRILGSDPALSQGPGRQTASSTAGDAPWVF